MTTITRIRLATATSRVSLVGLAWPDIAPGERLIVQHANGDHVVGFVALDGGRPVLDLDLAVERGWITVARPVGAA